MSTRGLGLAVGALFLSLIAFGNAAADAPIPTPLPAVRGSASPAELRAIVAGHVARIDQADKRVTKLNDESMRPGQKDAARILCLNDKVTQLHAARASSIERQREHEAALTHGDAELAAHQFTAIALLRRRAEQIDAEATQCIGTSMPGWQSHDHTVDPNIVDIDATFGSAASTGPAFPATPTIPLGPASPVR